MHNVHGKGHIEILVGSPIWPPPADHHGHVRIHTRNSSSYTTAASARTGHYLSERAYIGRGGGGDGGKLIYSGMCSNNRAEISHQ